MDSHVFGGFHFHYCLWSHCLCAAPTWVLITPIRECPFKYYITRKSCYSHHVCHEDINANSCFLLPFDACLYTKRDLFPVFIINDKQNYLRVWGLGRYIIFSSLNASSFQWHCGVKSSSSDFPGIGIRTRRPALVPVLPGNSSVTLSQLHLFRRQCLYL